MFKKILNKIKSAAKWVSDKVKSMAKKAKGWYKKHEETVDQFVIGAVAGTVAVGIAVGATMCVAKALDDPNYVPPTREEKLQRKADDLIFKAGLEDDPEQAQTLLRNAEILDRMSRKSKAEVATEKLREMGDFWDKYSNLRTAKASRMVTIDEAPLRSLSDPSGHDRLEILEFDKGYWINVNGDWSDEQQITLNQLGDVGKIIKDSFKLSTDSDDISDANMIDNIFIMAQKDKLKLDGVETI